MTEVVIGFAHRLGDGVTESQRPRLQSSVRAPSTATVLVEMGSPGWRIPSYATSGCSWGPAPDYASK